MLLFWLNEIDTSGETEMKRASQSLNYDGKLTNLMHGLFRCPYKVQHSFLHSFYTALLAFAYRKGDVHVCSA